MDEKLKERWYLLGCFSVCAQRSKLRDEEQLMISSAVSRGLRRFGLFMHGRMDMAVHVSTRRKRRG